ncbi:hypothetical protein F4677DRAFT_422521 [Hypoxylon crocopeplum]|nr:hypothetical protein F4677DRAFT_422521 [Hypoxylon crocopeplum]
MATSLAYLGVQYMNGACMLDMAAAPANLFAACSTVHIRIPENQHQVDVHSGMICIKPTEPDTPTYREQYINPNTLAPTNLPQAAPKQQQQRPPSFEGPGNPSQGTPPSSNGGDDRAKGGNTSPNMPSNYHESPSPTMRTRIRPAQPSTDTSTTCTSTLSRVSHFLQSTVMSSLVTPSPSSIRHGTSSTPKARFSTFITSPTPSPPSPPPSQEPPIDIPVPSTPPSTPTPPPPVPTEERSASPSPSPSPSPTLDNPPPPYCGTTYVNMDVSTIDDLDPHDLDLYLNLLGIVGLGLDLDHGIGGLLDGLLGGAVDDDETRAVRRELEHSYRVRCSTSLSEAESESMQGFGFVGTEEHVTASSQIACLEMCEKRAIGRARDGRVAECLGAAWRRGAEAEAGGDNCRFWTGGRDEFLPVDRLAPGDTGDWDLVYL